MITLISRIEIWPLDGRLPGFDQIAEVLDETARDLWWSVFYLDGTTREDAIGLDDALKRGEETTSVPVSWSACRLLLGQFFQVYDCDLIGIERGASLTETRHRLRIECHDSSMWTIDTADRAAVLRAQQRFQRTTVTSVSEDELWIDRS